MSIIADAVRDPSVDPAKMRDLLELHRELERDVDRREFVRHMSLLQSEISHIATDCANPQTNSKYASYQALDRALRPIYTAHGFSVGFDSIDSTRGTDWIRVVCIVTRGAWETRHHADVHADQMGPKGNKVMTATHAAASALSYGKRYSLAMAFNLAVARDDDGNAAGMRSITQSQTSELHSIIVNSNLDYDEICKALNIANIAEVPRAAFDKTKTWLLAKAKRKETA